MYDTRLSPEGLDAGNTHTEGMKMKSRHQVKQEMMEDFQNQNDNEDRTPEGDHAQQQEPPQEIAFVPKIISPWFFKGTKTYAEPEFMICEPDRTGQFAIKKAMVTSEHPEEYREVRQFGEMDAFQLRETILSKGPVPAWYVDAQLTEELEKFQKRRIILCLKKQQR